MRLVSTVAMLLLLPGLSFAGFSDNREVPSSNQKTTSPISVTGFAAIKKEIVGGMGRDMPIKSAIEQITPKAYTVIFKSILDDKVSWQGGVDWTDVLATVALTSNISVVVDTDKQTVTVQKVVGNSAEPSHKEAVATWNVRAGATLRETFANWASQSGWQLSWEAPEMVAEADVTVEGKFDTAIEMVIDALNRSGAGLRAVFYDANHILRITEKKQ